MKEGKVNKRVRPKRTKRETQQLVACLLQGHRELRGISVVYIILNKASWGNRDIPTGFVFFESFEKTRVSVSEKLDNINIFHALSVEQRFAIYKVLINFPAVADTFARKNKVNRELLAYIGGFGETLFVTSKTRLNFWLLFFPH